MNKMIFKENLMKFKKLNFKILEKLLTIFKIKNPLEILIILYKNMIYHISKI